MEKVYCKFCGKYVSDVCYLIKPDEKAITKLKDEIRKTCSNGTFYSKTLGCNIVVDEQNITFHDAILEKTMENYGMNAGQKMPDGTEKRIVSKYTRFAVTARENVAMDSYVGDFFHATQNISGVGKLDEETYSCIDGWYLTYSTNRNPACLLCCASCHMRLETHRVHSIQNEYDEIYYESEENTDKNINIMFFGTRSSGKTVLLLAILHELICNNSNSKNSFEKLNDSYVSMYYESLEQNLFLYQLLPPTTQTYQPPITLQVGNYRVTLIDTMGEMVGENKVIDSVEILNHSDAIVVIHPICKLMKTETPDNGREIQNHGEIDIEQTIHQLVSSCNFIDDLTRATQRESRKYTMLLFNKCDIFENVAREMMLEKECPSLSQSDLMRNLKDAQQIQLLRKVFFSRNSEVVITEICNFLANHTGDFKQKALLKEASKRLYQNCRVLSNDRVRIQCISPLGGPDPYHLNASPMYVSDFINMLIELCEEISNGKQTI